MSSLVYIILLAVALVACALGAVAAYFFYRARHREAVQELEALDQDLTEREEEIRRLQYQFTNVYPKGSSEAHTGSEIDVQKLREELEQKKIDYNILKQDFDLETGILRQEVEQLRKERADVDRTRRQVARRESELERTETDLERRRVELEAHEAELTAKQTDFDRRNAASRAENERRVAARMEEIEREYAERRKENDRLKHELDARDKALRVREEQIDQEIMSLSQDKFTSREEAILIKRLRQQIKLQREELEQLHLLYRRVESQLEQLRSGEHRAPRLEPSSPPPAARPSFSAISSYVDPETGGDAALAERSDRTHDRLTEIYGIDEETERRLYSMGITSFDQIAHWSSPDVRRVSERLGIDPKLIQDHWIIGAQSLLYAKS